MFTNVVEPPKPGMLYACPCCQAKTLSERGGYDICQICFWEDDGQDNHDADTVRGGPEWQTEFDASSSQLRRNWCLRGALSAECSQGVAGGEIAHV
jgi:hypothetical protein